VVTRSETTEEFLTTFRAFVDETSMFVPTRSPRPVGTRQAFLIQLKDGTPMLRGQGEVIESFPDGPAPAKRVGMRLKILSLDRASQELHTRLMQRKRATTLPPPFRGGVTPTVRFLVPPMPSVPGERSAETRAPGASYILPANPFSELPPEALEHFIDCTIYEDTGVPPETPPQWVGAASTSTSAPPVDGTERVVILPAPAAPPPTRNVALVAAVSLGAAAFGLVGGYLLWARPPEPPPRPRTATTATQITTQVPAPAPVPAAVPAPAPVPAAVPAAQAPAKAPDPEPTAVKPMPVAAPEPRQRDPEGPIPPPSPGDCVATFDTDPSGADVTVNGISIGPSPIKAAVVPCGPLTLGFTHARYERAEKKVTAAAGTPFAVNQRLVRPEATLEIVSSPPGATVLVHGENIGRAPARLKLDSFTTYKITATLEGHKVWSQSVYVRGRVMTVNARLDAMEGQRPRWRPGPAIRK
jgi:hypothetical protein